MKLVHDKHGETTVSSEQEARRLSQYGWRVAPEKSSRKRSKPAEPQPQPSIEDAPVTDNE